MPDCKLINAKDFMAHYLHDEIKDSLLKLYHKLVDTLPQWDVIAELARLTEMEPTFENVRFATHLYYVIEDLLHPVKHVWYTIEDVNESDKTISIVTHEVYENQVGIVDHPAKVHKPESIFWKNLYSGKTSTVLNENPKSYPISKLASQFAVALNDPDDTAPVENWINTKSIEENYQRILEPVIDRQIPRMTFERFIERLPEFSEPFVTQNLSIQTINHQFTPPIQHINMLNFLTEIRETFGKKYVKVKLKDKSRLKEIQILLGSLPSVKKVNITKNKELDLTIYPDPFFPAEETEKEVVASLYVVFNSKPSDPVIIDDVLAGISIDSYQKIINLVHHFGKNLEKFHGLHSYLDEEGFREYFLPYLNLMSKSHTATGETFNKIGKTDILIQNQQGENVFIAECKVWSGESNVKTAVDQLLKRYVTWRDEKLALIIFNKTVKGFSEIIGKALVALKNHSLCKQFTGQSNDSSGSFIFRHPDDPDKEVRLELLMFNCF